MAATGLQLNWTTVTFASSPITKVTNVGFDHGGSLIDFAGDNDRYPIVIANNMNKPKCSITSGDVATLMAIVPGTSGAIAATQIDAMAQTGGSIVWAAINAVAENCQDSGQFSSFATSTLSFQMYSSDGSTNPLSFTRT